MPIVHDRMAACFDNDNDNDNDNNSICIPMLGAWEREPLRHNLSSVGNAYGISEKAKRVGCVSRTQALDSISIPIPTPDPRFALEKNMLPRNPFVRYWLPLILLCLAIFVQSSFPSPDQLPHWHNSDKLLHAIVYGILAALFFRAFYFQTNQRWRSVWIFLVSALVSGLYGLSDEWHQSFVPARSADWVDWLADMLGAVFGSGLSLAGLYLYRQIGIWHTHT